jgi:hypothetical protein
VTLAAPWRKLILVLHVTSSVGFMGGVAAFLALAVTGLATTDVALSEGAYRAMRVVTWVILVPLAWTSLIIGVIQSLGTPWGLIRYYWVIIKLVLTLVAIVVLLLQTQTVDALSAAAASGQLAAYGGAKFSMVLHSTGGLAVLLVATILSIYKPRGLTRYGAAATTTQR